MVAHGLGPAQAKQIKDKKGPTYGLKQTQDWRKPPNCELQRRLSQSATDCSIYRIAHEQTMDHSALSGRKASDWPRLCHASRGRSSSLPLRSDDLNNTRSEYVSAVNWHSLPSISEGSPLMQFIIKEAVLLPHDIYN